jgi:hypothetical protein
MHVESKTARENLVRKAARPSSEADDRQSMAEHAAQQRFTLHGP